MDTSLVLRDDFGNDVSFLFPYLNLSTVAPLGKTKRLLVFDCDVKNSLARPRAGLAGLCYMARQRLDVPIEPPLEGIWEGKATRLLASTTSWSFHLASDDEVFDYIAARPWPMSWKVKRLIGFYRAIHGDASSHQDLFIKIDEILKNKADWEMMHAIVKSRPIFPASDAALIDWLWQVPLKKAMEDTILRFDYTVDSITVTVALIYVVKPNANALTDLFQKVEEYNVCIFIAGDDMVVFFGGVRAAAIDLKTCDLTCASEFQTQFRMFMTGLTRDDCRMKQIMREHGKRLSKPIKPSVRELEGTPYHVEKTIPESEVTTLTGETSTSIKATATWCFNVDEWVVRLEARGCVAHKEPSRAMEILLVGMFDYGFAPECELYDKDCVMPVQAVTFLGGSWVNGKWAPLKAIKSLFAPQGVFGNTDRETIAGWFRVCQKDELAILPIAKTFQKLVEVNFATECLDALALWDEYLRKTRDYRYEEREEPTYALSWEEWELQLCVMQHKAGADPANVLHMIAELKDLAEKGDTYPFHIKSSLVPLFIARFGELPPGNQLPP